MFIVLVLAVAIPVSAVTSECKDYSEYPHWISYLETDYDAQDILVVGEVAYLTQHLHGANQKGVVVVDVSDPEHPIQIGALEGTVGARDMVSVGQYLYLADSQNRAVVVVDVSDPASPFLVTQVSTGIYPSSLDLEGEYLYVAVRDDGVLIFDVSDPIAPLPLGALPVPDSKKVTVAGDLLYVNTSSEGVYIYDLIDPGAPSFVTQVTVASQGETWGANAQGDYAYVVGPYGMWVLDVSDVTNISVIGTYSWWAWDIVIDGDLAYLSSTGVDVLDLTDPAHPEMVTYLPEPGLGLSWIKSVSVKGGIVFAAADDAGLMIADVRVAKAPPRTTVLGFPAAAAKLRSWNSHLLVADQTEGLLVVDVADPESPNLVGTLASENAHAVLGDGDLAYLADGEGGLKIIDLTDVSAPLEIGHFNTVSGIYGAAVNLDFDGENVYLAAGLKGLMVINVADPASPSLLARLVTPGRTEDVCVVGDLVFIADDEDGLQVVDISDPAVPYIAGSLALPGHLHSLVWDGISLFVGGYNTGLWKLDISEPTAPEVVGWLPLDASDLALDGDFLLAAGGKGVQIVNRSDTLTLVSGGFIPTFERYPTICINDGFLFAAGDSLHAAARNCSATSNALGESPSRVWAELGAYPNPFNPQVEIDFVLSAPQTVRLEVVNLAGRLVATLAEGSYSVGRHSVTWRGRDDEGGSSSSGIYFLVLRGEAGIATRKVSLIR